jgi:hypothetical protein
MEIFHEKRYFYVQMQKSNLFVTENLWMLCLSVHLMIDYLTDLQDLRSPYQ